MKRFLLQFSKRLLVLLLALTLSSFQFNEENIREPFADYKVEQPYGSPSKVPIDWNSLDYDDYYWGWYYRQLWYLYHPNSSETPPWIKSVPLNGEYVLILFAFVYLLIISKKYIIKI